MIEHRITAGLSKTYKCEGCLSDVMPHFGSGGVLDYLVSTPVVMAMIIEASSSLLDPLLPKDFITVGKKIELDHLKPTIIDGYITIVVTVARVEGDRIIYKESRDKTGARKTPGVFLIGRNFSFNNELNCPNRC